MADTTDPKIYTIGWICAIETEFLAAQIVLDEAFSHKDTPAVGDRDDNSYVFGRIESHNIVVAVLPHKQYGTTRAATVARDMVNSFPNVRVGLMVGIAGGVPYGKERDVRLGDVVVSCPDGSGAGGVIQFDFGKNTQNQTFRLTGHLNQPPEPLLMAVAGLKTKYRRYGHKLDEKVKQALDGEVAKTGIVETREELGLPLDPSDRLYQCDFTHEQCKGGTCGDSESEIKRDPRKVIRGSSFLIHYGLVGSSNSLVRNAVVRDRLAQDQGILCVEMETAGLANHFPCLAIRGICAYSDTHTNDKWQGFAAMMAAAYAKDLIKSLPPKRVDKQKPLADALRSEVQKDIGAVKQDVEEIKAVIGDSAIRKWLPTTTKQGSFDSWALASGC
ncbi:hypothetical protein GGTG_06478 [Gaeumannomyces tritici R3-111a-1]|uniref:Uncharacterized protein n=1 Tax=Gaeumannomyces tritici (strain R3-111a-1) TaxID=644352 RepID=J3NYX7_GAET3|nr:hypothetical protein GGTG_06478 [Gaeumannomyces tritici R3-111a-1]EJT76560.1 hypothetical protein GGTG_06478 [Gaeumannomyces tritici R3-111a-1]